ncbi:MAG: site-2 protease family protein [Actinobacteria bacterium HGW-Actinobacteria-1]|nr:MAG: site-2 protease family protein [Actinobacteria bacterium HGW-Actinobacteria-1]
MGNIDIVGIILRFALLIPAIVFHEVAHGYAALALGDTTAKDQGRLSLNPIAHIDPWGTILLPLLMTAMFGAGFGYAKPVPVNPYRFRGDRRVGMFLTGIAGPTANLVMATIAGIIVRILGVDNIIGTGAYLFALVNLVLLFFNLIPLPPLDGSRVLPLILPQSAMNAYHQWERYGFIILIAILWIVPAVFHFDPFTAYFKATVFPILTLLTGV